MDQQPQNFPLQQASQSFNLDQNLDFLKDILVKKLEDNQFVEKLKNMNKAVKDFFLSQKKSINDWFKMKSKLIIRYFIIKVQVIVSQYIIDKNMPSFLKNIIEDIVSESWPAVEEQIFLKFKIIEEDKAEKELREKKKEDFRSNILCKPFNWLLYTLHPFDKNIWFQLNNIWWWIFLILKSLPVYNIQMFFYFFIFLIIDKRDEWQLIQFIIQFKGLQFISTGVVNSLIGIGKFYSCSIENSQNTEKCIQNSPMSTFQDIIGFLIQIVLVWICFLLLQCSHQKGKKKLLNIEESIDSNEQNHSQKQLKNKNCFCVNIQKKGRRLRVFMLWDLFTIIICVIGYLIFSQGVIDKSNNFQEQQLLFFIRTVYGTFSFPFLIFVIPLSQEILTLAKPTGYNKEGQCLPVDIQKTEIIKNQEIENFDIENMLQQKNDPQQNNNSELLPLNIKN